MEVSKKVQYVSVAHRAAKLYIVKLYEKLLQVWQALVFQPIGLQTYCNFLETSNLLLFGGKRVRVGQDFKSPNFLVESMYAQTTSVFASHCTYLIWVCLKSSIHITAGIGTLQQPRNESMKQRRIFRKKKKVLFSNFKTHLYDLCAI